MAGVTPSPGGDALSVDPAALRQMAERVNGLAEGLAEKSKTVAKETEVLIENWIGRSADRWGPEFKDWLGGNEKLVAELEEFAGGLREAAQAYIQTEGDNEQDIAAESPRLNLET